MDYYSIAIGFITGFACSQILVGLLGLGRSVRFFREIEQQSIMILASVTEALAYIQQVKHNYMIEVGTPESTIKLTKNVEDHNFELWKASVISNVKSNYPKNIQPDYNGWTSALQLLDKIYSRKGLDKT